MKKRKKKVKDEEGQEIKKRKEQNPESDEESDNLEDKVYTRPSLKSLVKMEDKKSHKRDPQEEERTVFVGNLPSNIKTKRVKALFAEFGEIESIRFRGAARPDMKTTKKVAVITRKFHEGRSNINAYVRFKVKENAIKSCKLNGTGVSGHVIRVQSEEVGQKKDHDHKKSVFIGNLDFSVEEDELRKHFKACGNIVGVRVVRDSATGVGKGFGYVNFVQEGSVELALQLHNSTFKGRNISFQECSEDKTDNTNECFK